MLWQAGVRNVFAPRLNVGKADREPGPALGAAILLGPLTFGRTRLDEEPLWLLVMRNQVRDPLPFRP